MVLPSDGDRNQRLSSSNDHIDVPHGGERRSASPVYTVAGRGGGGVLVVVVMVVTSVGPWQGALLFGGDALRPELVSDVPSRIESNSGSSNSPFCAPGTELSPLAFKISFYPTPRRALELLWLPPLHTGFSPTSSAQKIQPPASSFLVKPLTLPSTPLISSPVT